MKAIAVAAVLLVAFAGLAKAQSDMANLVIEFDNRGSKVMSKTTNDRILNALCTKIFMTASCKQVALAGGMGQSSLLNHKSTVTYVAVGPTTNGKSLLANCQASVKSGWFSKSSLEKSLKKATDTWAIGDSVSVKKAQCAAPVTASRTGRKMAL